MRYINNDGGRKAAGHKGKSGDCVTRAVAIATGRPYAEVYAEITAVNARVPRSKRRKRTGRSAAHGVYTRSKAFKDYMIGNGFAWTPTMFIGSGCKVHMADGELPHGRLVAMVSRHAAAVIDGILHDTHDCSRGGSRCVYGYWRKES